MPPRPSTSTRTSGPRGPDRPSVSPSTASWRQEWYASHRGSRENRPSDEVLERALALPVSERRLAATITCPTPVPASELFEFWISAPTLTQTFPLPVILDSLLSTETGSDTWAAVSTLCHGFSMTRSKGVRFFCSAPNCSDRLNGVSLLICGKPHTIKASSKFASHYSVQLHRVPASVSAAAIFDLFVSHDCEPLSVYPTFAAGPLSSNTLTVLFSSASIPAFIWSGNRGEAPLRELSLATGHPLTFVVHPRQDFNDFAPPSLTPLAPAAPPTRPVTRAEPITTASPIDATDAFTLDRPLVTDTPQAWYRKIKAATVPYYLPPPTTAVTHVLYIDDADDSDASGLASYRVPYQGRYAAFLSDETSATLPPDVDVILHPTVGTTPIGVPPHLTSWQSSLKDTLSPAFDVESMTLVQLTEFLDAERAHLREDDYSSALLTSIQAQPSIYRTFYDSCTPGNIVDLECHVAAHACHRLVSRYDVDTATSSLDILDRIYAVGRPLASMDDDNDDDTASFISILRDVATRHNDPRSIDELLALARWDLYCMINAPSIYFDFVKLAAVCSTTEIHAIAESHHLLWSDVTLLQLLRSDVGQQLVTSTTQPTLTSAFTLLASISTVHRHA